MRIVALERQLGLEEPAANATHMKVASAPLNMHSQEQPPWMPNLFCSVGLNPARESPEVDSVPPVIECMVDPIPEGPGKSEPKTLHSISSFELESAKL